MLKGAIFGDIVGSVYEFDNIKTKDFPLVTPECTYTDDTVMTIAVAKALIKSYKEKTEFKATLTREMQAMGNRYPHAGYGDMFMMWIEDKNPTPYNSYGNGSAMRVSPCGFVAVELAEALLLAKASAEVTHNHPEGIKGAQAVAGAIFLARCHKPKKEIADFIRANFYALDKTLDEIRPDYKFDVSCQGSVPQAIQAFLESNSYEDAIRNAISIGGDSDTIAAITGSIAWAYYKNDRDFKENDKSLNTVMETLLPEEFINTIEEFNKLRISREGTYDRTGFCSKFIVDREGVNPYKLKLGKTPLCLDSTPLSHKLNALHGSNLLNRFCSSKDFAAILSDLKLGISNYTDFGYLTEIITARPEYLFTASLEECFIHLTYLWRADYHSGGYPQFRLSHSAEIYAARLRIIDLLTDY